MDMLFSLKNNDVGTRLCLIIINCHFECKDKSYEQLYGADDVGRVAAHRNEIRIKDLSGMA